MDEIENDWLVVEAEDLPTNENAQEDFEIIELPPNTKAEMTEDGFELIESTEQNNTHVANDEDSALPRRELCLPIHLLEEEQVTRIFPADNSPTVSLGLSDGDMPSFESQHGESPMLNIFPKNTNSCNNLAKEVFRSRRGRCANELTVNDIVQSVVGNEENVENWNLSQLVAHSNLDCRLEENVAIENATGTDSDSQNEASIDQRTERERRGKRTKRENSPLDNSSIKQVKKLKLGDVVRRESPPLHDHEYHNQNVRRELGPPNENFLSSQQQQKSRG